MHQMNLDMNTIGVVGLGQLGRGVAACCLAHGFRVIGIGLTEEDLEKANLYIARAIEELIQHADFPQELSAEWRNRYTSAISYESLAECDFVIESVTEDIEVKQDSIAQIEAVVSSEVPIASNTSSLPITSLQTASEHPQRILGMHWAEPPHATRFMELIRGDHTSDGAFLAASELAEQFSKEPALVCKDVPAFIVNRLEYAIHREALHILEMGVADKETIDRAFRNASALWGGVCGPFRLMDLHGGPTLYANIMERVWPTLSNASELPATMKELREANASGCDGGHGFYEYDQAEQETWRNLMAEHAWTVRQLQDKYFPLTKSKSVGNTH